MKKIILGLVLLFILFISLKTDVQAVNSAIKIGVLSTRGYETTLDQWQGTALYLSHQIPNYTFTIIPLDFNEIEESISHKQVDFVLTNPAYYVLFEKKYGARRIATLKNIILDNGYSIYGGTIFTRKDRTDIKTLQDLKGKTFAATDEMSLGGWLAAKNEFLKQKINPEKDFKKINFLGTHDAVVLAVLNKEFDAGTVNSSTLEKLMSDKKINEDDIKIINLRQDSKFPFVYSTDLYPEWPMASLSHTEDSLVNLVASALLLMPSDSIAAKSANIKGWVSPLNYQPVHDLLEELKLPPYEAISQITIRRLIEDNLSWFILIIGLVIILILLMLNLILKNKVVTLKQIEADQLFNITPNAIFTTDLENKIKKWNQKAQEITGYSSQEIINKHIKIIIPEAEKWLFVHDIELANLQLFTEEIVIKTKEKKQIPALYSISPMINPDGEIYGYVHSFADISHEKKIQQNLKKRSIELERLNQAIMVEKAHEKS